MEGFDFSSFQGKNVLITGGLGLTGSHLVRRLVNIGAKVVIYNKSENNIESILEIRDKVHIVLGDVIDYNKVELVVRDKDCIFHLASQSSVPVSMEHPFLDLDVNVKGTLNILESCKKINRNCKIVFAGTVREAGVIKGPILREDIKENPTSIFDLHKLTSEKYLQIYNKVYGLKTVTLRFSNVYGEIPKTDIHRSMISHIVKKALIDKKLEIYGDGGPLRDYNYVENVVDACLLAAQTSNTDGKYYVLGSGEGNTFNDFIEKLQKIIKNSYGIEIEINKVAVPDTIAKTVQGDVIVDYSKLHSDSGWYPRESFLSGLKKTIEFYSSIY